MFAAIKLCTCVNRFRCYTTDEYNYYISRILKRNDVAKPKKMQYKSLKDFVEYTQHNLSANYFKITNRKETHNGYTYNDGLNILPDSFNNDPLKKCGPGGFYFTDIRNIHKHLCFDSYLREIELPLNDPDFLMVQIIDGYKWRANRIILGPRFDLDRAETFIMLIKKGAVFDICEYNRIVKIAFRTGDVRVLEFLKRRKILKYVDVYDAIRHKNINILEWLNNNNLLFNNVDHGSLFRTCCRNGYLDIAKWILQLNKKPLIDIHHPNEYVLESFCKGGIKYVEWLIKLSQLSEFIDTKKIFQQVCVLGYLEIAKLLVEMSKLPEFSYIIIPKDNKHTFIQVCCSDHLELAKWLFELSYEPGFVPITCSRVYLFEGIDIYVQISCDIIHSEAKWLFNFNDKTGVRTLINVSAENSYIFKYQCKVSEMAMWLLKLSILGYSK